MAELFSGRLAANGYWLATVNQKGTALNIIEKTVPFGIYDELPF